MSILSLLPRRRADASSATVLVIVCAGVVLASLDLFIVNVALPDIARDLHTTNLADLSWVLNAYAIVYASLLVLFGRLAESHRREYGFLLGVALFTAASAACGAATDLTMLIVFRIVQAAGAALLTPTSLSLVLATTAPERRHGGPHLDRGRRPGGRARAGRRRPAGHGRLALGVLRQRTDRIARAGRRLATAAAHRRPSGPGARCDRRVAGDRRRRAADARSGEGQRLGVGRRPTIGALVAAIVALALFALHCARASNPLIAASLFRSGRSRARRWSR